MNLALYIGCRRVCLMVSSDLTLQEKVGGKNGTGRGAAFCLDGRRTGYALCTNFGLCKYTITTTGVAEGKKRGGR